MAGLDSLDTSLTQDFDELQQRCVIRVNYVIDSYSCNSNSRIGIGIGILNIFDPRIGIGIGIIKLINISIRGLTHSRKNNNNNKQK